MNFWIVLRKELLEQWRTRRWLIVAAVLVGFGLASPLLAKLTPQLLKAVPDLPPGLAEMIPQPTLADAVAQYLKNLGQFGILLAVLMSMGAVAGEKERGTAAFMLSHPLPRSTFLLAKFVALAILFAVNLALAMLAGWYYTLLLFEALPWGDFLALNGLLLVVFLVYSAITLLGSTLARNQGMAAGLAFGALAILLVFGSLPGLRAYFPSRLLEWGEALSLGRAMTAWPALWVSLALIVVALGVACLLFERQEL